MLRFLIVLLVLPMGCASIHFTRSWHPDPQQLPAGPASCLVPDQNSVNDNTAGRMGDYGVLSVQDLSGYSVSKEVGRVRVLGLANPCVTGNLKRWGIGVVTLQDTVISPLDAPDPRLEITGRLDPEIDYVQADKSLAADGSWRMEYVVRGKVWLRICVTPQSGLIQRCN